MIPHVPALRKTSCFTQNLLFSERGRRGVGDALERYGADVRSEPIFNR